MSRDKSHHGAKHSINTDKKRKNKNALVHGIYSKDFILPWESREDFDRLYAGLCADFNPVGSMQQETVLDIAFLRWQKQRVRKMWHAAAYLDPLVKELVELGKKSWSGIRGYLREQSRSSDTMTGALHELFSQLVHQATKAGRALSKGEGQDEADIEEKGHQIGAILTMMSERVLSLIRDVEAGPNAEQTLGKAYSPGYLEPLVRIEALIDARIDKALGRIVNLQEYQRLAERPALLPSPLSGRRELEVQPKTINH